MGGLKDPLDATDMSSPTPLLKFPVHEPTTLDQAADLVEDFALQTSIDALAALPRAGQEEDSRAVIAAAREQALALTEQSRLVEEELARFLERASGA
jgi:hypothetical protein